MEGRERAAVEARVLCLNNISVLLDAAVLQLQQYTSIVAALRCTLGDRGDIGVAVRRRRPTRRPRRRPRRQSTNRRRPRRTPSTKSVNVESSDSPPATTTLDPVEQKSQRRDPSAMEGTSNTPREINYSWERDDNPMKHAMKDWGNARERRYGITDVIGQGLSARDPCDSGWLGCVPSPARNSSAERGSSSRSPTRASRISTNTLTNMASRD
jgi:hypothetical protein